MNEYTDFPIPNINIPALPDLGSVTDASMLVLERAGTGRVNASAFRDYVTSGMVADAQLWWVNVKDHGAVGDGVADDTAACQAAITAAGNGGTVFFPTGTYKLSATLNGLYGQTFIGQGVRDCILTRTADYGDTLKFAQAWGVTVKNLWFQHSTMYGLSDTSLANRVTSSTAHIRLQNAQSVLIEDCWLWRMPYQIEIESGSLIKIHRCHAQGTWDPNYVAAQEGVAGVRIGIGGYTQIVAIEHCYMAGSGNGPRNVTFTSTDTGAHTFSITQNCGNQQAILILQCEDFILANTYLGGNSVANVSSLPVGGSVNLDWRFTSNFFDGAGLTGAALSFLTQADNIYPSGVTITGNVFNGEMQTQNHIVASNPFGNNPTITNFAITGNTFTASVGSVMMLNHARGGTITGNSMTSYNARNVTAGGDVAFCVAVYFAAHASHIIAQGNLAGGSTGAVDTPSYAYRDFYLTGAPGSNVAINNIVVGGGMPGNINGMSSGRVVLINTTGNYTMIGNEDVILVNKPTNESTQIFLPTGYVPPGFMVTIKDGKGNANLYATQVVGNIDGVDNPLYSVAFFQRKLLWNGAAWNVIGA